MKHLLILFLILFSFFCIKNPSFSQNASFYKPLDLEDWIDAEFTKGLKAYNIPGACFVLIQGDSVRHVNGYGVADIETKTPVNFESIFRIGSISKTFVAAAAMQLWEEGKLSLDVDINNYLKTFQIDYKFNDSITVRNLLTHSAGFDDRNIGWIVDTKEEVIPLAQYLKKRMPPQIRPAGTCITYTNHAYGLLALVVEEVSGLLFYEYVTQNILKPLEMYSSGFKTHDELEKNYVSSYLPKDGELIPFKPIFMLNYPTGSLSSTATDMGHYISMFLNNGNYKDVPVLDSTTVFKMHQTEFKNYKEAGLGWLLGFSELYQNGFHIIRHMGMYQGFTSDLILVPELNTGFFLV
jgi:CubicO group peptidase (beta-lactamase class C family)